MKYITNKTARIDSLSKDAKGATAVEIATLLPLFLIVMLGIIDMGQYFLKNEVASNTLNNITQVLEQNPANAYTLNFSQYGDAYINFHTTNNGNYICVWISPTPLANPACNGPSSSVTVGAITAGKPYYIYSAVRVGHALITPLGNFVASIKNLKNTTGNAIVQNTGWLLVNNGIPNCSGGLLTSVPTNTTAFSCVTPCSTGSNQVLSFSNGVFTCPNIQSTVCKNPWQEWNAQTNQCDNVPYIIAAGMANPNILPVTAASAPGDDGYGASSTWTLDTPDSSMANVYLPAVGSYWMPSADTASGVNDFTLCKGPITFPIPAGLPNGQLVPSGNLTYLTGNVVTAWHDWVVSFILNPSYGGTSGSFWICESNGGNWVNGTYPGVGAEHVSWVVTWVPTAGPLPPAQSQFYYGSTAMGTFSR